VFVVVGPLLLRFLVERLMPEWAERLFVWHAMFFALILAAAILFSVAAVVFQLVKTEMNCLVF
jgi:hypothetical protein